MLDVVSSTEARPDIMARFVQDMSAPSSRASACSLWKTWSDFHTAWFGAEEPILPLTPAKLFAVAACFKEGGYKGFPAYMSKAREMHIISGNNWGEHLDLARRKATASVLRGVGVARQSAPFDLLAAVRAVREGKVRLGPLAPVGWDNFLVVAAYFIMREIEAAAVVVEHVTVSCADLKVSLRLPVSKKDPRAVGCTRSWSCLCAGSPMRVDCPFHAIACQLKLLEDKFGLPLASDLPLFPDDCGTVCSKVNIIDALEATIIACGVSVHHSNGSKAFGGHSFRVTGAQRLASLGVEVSKIMILARWAGDTVLRYIREAPLENLPAEVAALEEKRNLLDLLSTLRREIQSLSSQLGNQQRELGSLREETANQLSLEVARVSADLQSKFGPASTKPYIARCAHKRFKVHRAVVDGCETPPSNWKTQCGLRFGFWSFTRHASLDNFPKDILCGRCFAQSSSGSSSSSSSIGMSE